MRVPKVKRKVGPPSAKQKAAQQRFARAVAACKTKGKTKTAQALRSCVRDQLTK